MPNLAALPIRLALCAIALTVLAGSSPSVAQVVPAAKKECAPVQKSEWEIEHERLLHEDWPNLGRYRQANAALTAPAGQRVVFMGDSITEGWRATAHPEGAEMGAFFAGKPYINRGISGQTTPQMLVRFRQDVIALHPAVVVILAGTNDLAHNTGPTTLEAIEDNLAAMCELSRLHGIRVVLASVLPAADYSWNPGLQPAHKIVALNRWLNSYAEANHYLFVDLHTPMATAAGGMRPELSEDGVHPNHAGYELMAARLEPAIEAALKAERQ